jgi:hypothetical protein
MIPVVKGINEKRNNSLRSIILEGICQDKT